MRITHAGASLEVEESGSGIPLLLLHAFPLHRRMWAPQLAALGARARCLAPDIRGFGESDAVPPFSIDQFADDAFAALDAAGVEEPAVVCGLSMGGYIAFAMWKRHPERIRALILADTRPTADGADALENRRAMIRTAREQGSGAIAEAQAPKMVSPRTRERSPEVVERIASMIAAQRPDGIIGATEAMMGRPDSTELLGGITVPTLIIVGEDDAITPPEISQAMHEAIPGSRLETIAGAGHLSSLERPASFTSAVAAFLSDLG